MTNNRLNALERETTEPKLRAIWGTSPAAVGARNEKSATAIAKTLLRLTATDIVRIARANGIEPSLLLHSCVKD